MRQYNPGTDSFKLYALAQFGRKSSDRSMIQTCRLKFLQDERAIREKYLPVDASDRLLLSLPDKSGRELKLL